MTWHPGGWSGSGRWSRPAARSAIWRVPWMRSAIRMLFEDPVDVRSPKTVRVEAREVDRDRRTGAGENGDHTAGDC